MLADALTSVFAIVALIVGKFYGWLWMDALMGIVGAVVISKWALGLLKETSSILLDGGDYKEREIELQKALCIGYLDTIQIQLWKTGPQHFAVSIFAPQERLAEIKQTLPTIPWISHSSVACSEREES